MNVLFTYGFIYGNPQSINYPVWNALLVHLDFLKKSNNVYILLRNESLYNELKAHSSYSDLNYVVYTNKKSLLVFLKDNKIDLIFSPDIISTVKLSYLKFLHNYKILTWYQGAFPEESYLKNKSNVRKFVLDCFEKFSLRISDKNVFVSESMLEHYSSKHNYQKHNYLIVPCFSDFSNQNEDRIKDSFVYIGSLSKWQCFDEIVTLMGKIKKENNNAVFHIITLDVEMAKQIVLQKLGTIDFIDIYPINNRDEIPNVLSKFEYGFLIRDNSVINRVSSPIKFAEYLSCGVNIIMTDTIKHFAKIILDNNVGTVIEFNKLEDKQIKLNQFKNALPVYQKEFNKEELTVKYQNFVSEK